MKDEKWKPVFAEWKPAPSMYPAGAKPSQRVVGETEEGNEITVPATPYEIWVDPSGNIINLPVRTSRSYDPKRRAYGDDGPYIYHLKAQKRNKKWFPYAFDHQNPLGVTDEAAWPAARDAEIEKRKSGVRIRGEKFAKIWAREETVALKNPEVIGEAVERAIAKAQKRIKETKE